MTTKTKTITLTTLVIVLLLFCLSFRPVDNQTDSIMIRSTQIAFGGKNKSFIRVYKGDNQIEKIQIDKWEWDEEEKNYDKILTTVKTYEKQGYQIISHSEVMFGTNGFVNTFILTKK